MKDFSADDLYLHRQVTELHCVPGRDMAVATVRSVQRESNTYVSCVWCFEAGSAKPRQLTRGPGRDKSPRLSPDGRRLAFLSDRGGGAPQLFVMDLLGGEARQLGNFELGVTALRWSPDGKSLFISVALAVDPELRGRRGNPPGPREGWEPEVCWRLPYKSDGVGYVLAREIHLFSVDADSGDSRQLTHGAFDVQAFEPSANGKHVAFSRTREGRYAHATDLWVCDTDGSGTRRLTHELATVMQPSWSPDGRWIAFAGAMKEGDGQSALWLFDFASGRLAPLGPADLEVAEPDSLCWDGSGRLLLVRAHRGRHEGIAVSVPHGTLETLVTGDRQLGAFACNGQQIFHAPDTPVLPSDVYCCRCDGSGERRLSDFNPWWRERTPLALAYREFEVPDGRGGRERVQGWLLHARDRQLPMPLLNDVHGGPASYVLLDFDTNVYWQVLCSRGWGVVLLNAVGSSSFGREFCERLSGHWGEYDLPQHLAALRQLLREGTGDGRLAIAGKSYGGYLAGWAIGHCDYFRAAVVMAPVGNIETHYGTSDGGYYADPLYVDTQPEFDRQRARDLSPLQSIERATTPTLFMQGKEDERCPKCQSEELFVSMYRAGETLAELVLYPSEDHHFLGSGTPHCRADAVRRIVHWVTSHIGEASGERCELQDEALPR